MRELIREAIKAALDAPDALPQSRLYRMAEEVAATNNRDVELVMHDVASVVLDRISA